MVVMPERHRRLQFESLEPRSMMAGLTAALDNSGTLSILGTEAADTITVRQTTRGISVDGVTGYFATAQVKKIVVDARGGDDTIRLDSESVSGQTAITAASYVYAGIGNDIVRGGAGRDVIFGGDGNDTLYGGIGDDYLDGGAGNDTLAGLAGNDQLFGDLGDDTLQGGDGGDVLVGGDGSDTIYGGNGDDYLDGGRGFDNLYGESGNDVIYDDAGANTNLVQGGLGANSTIAGHFAWFDMNTQDAALRSFARTLYVDKAIDRADMIALFNQVKADGTVSAAELADMRAIVAAASTLATPDYVRVLASDVVNANAANSTYLGTNLGNLAAGSTGAQLDKLVSKWFLGTDHPVAVSAYGGTVVYRQAAGQLFVGGPSYDDVRQGYLGDCYLLASLGETALRTPSAITSMFIDNGDGTYTVRFFNNGKADYVTVDKQLPTDTSGRFIFANCGGLASNTANELWVALAEKAYVQMAAAGWIRGPMANAYQAIAGGYIADAEKQISGRATSLGNAINQTNLVAAFNAGALVGLASKSSPTDATVVGGHAYALIGYDARTQTFTLFNPWGVNNGSSKPGVITLTFAQLQANFSYFDRTTA